MSEAMHGDELNRPLGNWLSGARFIIKIEGSVERVENRKHST